MTNPYTSVTISGYNPTPPADDGSQVASNQVSWAKHKDKLADPIKTLSEAINTELLSTFSKLDLNLSRAITANDTQLAADERKLISATNTITYTLLPVATAADGFAVTVLNAGTGVVTIEADGAELINDALNLALNPNEAAKLRCNAVGWDIVSLFEPIFVLKDGSELTISTGSITPTANYHTVDTESDDATDDLTDIVTTNIPDGGLLVIRAENTARDVVVKHTASGANKIVTVTGDDITLDDAVQSVTLQRRGDHWEELTRSDAGGGGGGSLVRITVFTGSGTWTDQGDITSVEVDNKASGGGGGGADTNASEHTGAGGGGEGGRAILRIPVASLGATETVTINAGGTAGNNAGSNGGTGGTVSFGAHCSATGGLGGLGTGSGAADGTFRRGGVGGAGSGGDINITGAHGHTGNANIAPGISIGGPGGGEGGGQGAVDAAGGAAGVDGGGGGGGAATGSGGDAGFAGGDGYVIVREYA